MEPDAKRPMVIAAVAILLVVVVILEGFAPLVRFQIIQLLIARCRRSHGAASINDPSRGPGPFRRNWLVVAIIGAPVVPSTVDVEQVRTAPPPYPNFSSSTSSLVRPPPAYTNRHRDGLYSGAVVHYGTSGRSFVAVPAQYPPPYASSPSLGGAPRASTAS